MNNSYAKYTEFLKATYKNQIIPGKKTTEEIRSYLKETFDAEPYDITKIEPKVIQIEKENSFHCCENEKFGFSLSEMEVEVFLIPRNEKNQIYYDDMHCCLSGGFKDEPLILFLETKLATVSCLSNKLFREVYLSIGISQEDYDEESIIFYDYCMKLDNMEHSFMF